MHITNNLLIMSRSIQNIINSRISVIISVFNCYKAKTKMMHIYKWQFMIRLWSDFDLL